MKRVLPILLMALLLIGCSSGETPETTATDATNAPTAPVELISLYDADSAAEQQTGGAVRAYPLGDGAYIDLLTMGEKLLVVSGDGILTVLQGEKGEVAATGFADLSGDSYSIAAGETGIAYYAANTRQIVLLDPQLQEQQSVTLPEECQSTPLIQTGGEVFYCVGSEIRAFNIRTGVSRLVRQHSCVSQELTGSYFDDTVIGCRITDEQGTQRVVYLSAQTGEVFHTDQAGWRMESSGDAYFAVAAGEEGNQYVFGSQDTEPMNLYPETETVMNALPLGGVVGCSADDTQGLQLKFYDLATGKKTSEVTLNGVGMPQAMAADGSFLWLVADSVLYRWDISATQTAEQAVYTGPRYTAERPDTAGLADCQLRVQQLRDTYGLSLYIWEDAQKMTQSYTLEEEYRVSVINDCLDQIEAMVKTFPEGFLAETGNVSFYLVDALKDGKPAAQYWENAACHVVISSEEPLKSFLWGLGFAIDTYVLNHCREFDNWDNLNPRDFAYTYDYEENLLREDWEDDLDYFIDLESMSFPTEDRSRIFMYALLPEGAEYFTENDLQDKLLQVCEGIREAYELEDSTEIFPWEQYLEDPLAREA